MKKTNKHPLTATIQVKSTDVINALKKSQNTLNSDLTRYYDSLNSAFLARQEYINNNHLQGEYYITIKKSVFKTNDLILTIEQNDNGYYIATFKLSK